MGVFKDRKDRWGNGAALLLLFIGGWMFFQEGTARLTALAARQPIGAFLSEEEERPGLLERASGVHTLASFLDGQETVLAQADPSYIHFKEEQGAEGQLETGETETGETAAAQQEETEAGTAAETENSEEAPAMAATEVTGTVYSAEQLANFDFVKDQFFYVHKSTTVYPEQLDAQTLLGKDMTLPESDEPQILLFHTHGSEAFADSSEDDPEHNIVGVGNYLAQLLSEQYGIQVIHNTEVFPYSDAYSMALDMIEENLAAYPSIQVTIDLHRDAGGHETVEIGGKQTAPIMFFNGMCQTPDGPLEGVENPYLMDNLAFNFQMKLKAEAYYPGFTQRTFLKAYRYNQHVLPRATLIECGTENNTFEEARNAMEPLADILYKVLRGK